MRLPVHYQAPDPAKRWSLHTWTDRRSWDLAGTRVGNTVDFEIPADDVTDWRTVEFKFRSEDEQGTHWEPDTFIRYIRVAQPAELWCFPNSPRILYQPPFPQGAAFRAGDVLRFHIITANRFAGGRIYAWNPYGGQHAAFPEVRRDESASTSVVDIPLADWMTAGFHFKLVKGDGDNALWEPDSANRVWRPCDGASMWIKSGQVNVRQAPLILTPVPVEVLYPATMPSPPRLDRDDQGDDPVSIDAVSTQPYPGSLFRVAAYRVGIYPDAPYWLSGAQGSEGDPAVVRSFPPDPTNPAATARMILGAGGWVADFPAVAPSVTLSVEPSAAQSAFDAGLRVEASIGATTPYETTAAQRQPDGTWQAVLDAVPNARTYLRFLPAAGPERLPYEWIDTSRHVTPTGAPETVFATEQVFGLTLRGRTEFAEPPSRTVLMEAAFGPNIAGAGVFGPREMPHGATVAGNDVWFVLHAPHAVRAELVLIDEHAPGGPARTRLPMTVTPDVLYWWVRVPKSTAPPGARYRFALNDGDEVLDPAAREVRDGGSFDTSPADNPADPATSWSVVIDAAAVHERSHRRPWNTAGWESLLIYELHARRFTQLSPGGRLPLELLVDELQPVSRLGVPGYLRQLPVTALELLPVHEFEGYRSWGYNPAFYFAVDSSYGGATAMAEFVDAAHAAGKAVILDVVYNHSQASPLMRVARDVYRNGEAWGDRMNCGHSMVLEYLRQATVYMWRTFNLCGFRFDDTKTIVRDCWGGWGFLGAIRDALGKAANAEGRRWPYAAAENDREGKAFDIPNPAWGVLPGEWAWDEVFRLRDVSYNTRNGGDDAGRLKEEMDKPYFDGRPFYIAVRHAENHDRVSGQDAADQRIAARAPFGQGLRLAKALGTIPLLSNGVPLLFMGEEYGETRPFSFDNYAESIDPQRPDLPAANGRVLAWFRSLMGLRNDPVKGLRGQSNYQVVSAARRTVAFTCGAGQCLFAVVTWGTPDQRQDSSWLGLPGGAPYKEIFNSSWPVFQVEGEPEYSNGSYDAWIWRGQTLSLPYLGAIVLERR